MFDRSILLKISRHKQSAFEADLDDLLLEKPFYENSDDATRLLLRARALHFAKRHKLSLEQAVSLWKGEPRRAEPMAWLFGKCLLWLPFVIALLGSIWLSVFFWRELSFGALLLALLVFSPIWEGSALLIEGIVRLLWPASPLPALKKELAPPVCAMLVVSAKDSADSAIRSLEMLLAANREADGLFGLIITLPDAPTQHASTDASLCEPFLSAFEKLEKRSDRPLRLCVAKRSYLPHEKRWRGMPAEHELLTACAMMLTGDGSSFDLTVGKKSPPKPPVALYIASQGSILSPDGLRQLACTLFHPLCTVDCVLPILATTDSTSQHRLYDRLTALTKRQVTLQKLGRSLPYRGQGMVRLSAIISTDKGGDPPSISASLASATLFVASYDPPRPTAHRTEEALLLEQIPDLRLRISALTRLPLYLMLLTAPPSVALIGLLASSADLISATLLSLSIGQRFFTHTMPHLFGSGKRILHRRFFPAQQFFCALPYVSRLPKSIRMLSSSLFAVIVGIFTAAIIPFPLSIIGLCWAASPLFATLSTEKRKKSALSAADRANLLVYGKKYWAFFEQYVTTENPIPPTLATELPYPIASSDTTPDAFAFYLIACLSACDLGKIDPFTLEKRLREALNAWEALPDYHGLPYARYSLETGDSAAECGVDTALCGRFAIAMAATEQGIIEYAEQNPALTALAERVGMLWRRMDFTRLYDAKQSAFFEALLPSGKGIGKLDLLVGRAESACIAAMALGQIDYAAWKKLRRPASGKGLKLGMASMWGSLEDYLLDALFLPSTAAGLIGRSRSHALSVAKKTEYLYSSAFAILPDGNPTDSPQPSGHPELAVMQSEKPFKLAPAHIAFLMLPFSPSSATKSLRRFEEIGASGRFGFYEAVDLTDGSPHHVVPILSSAHIGQALAGLVNGLRSNAFCRRLMREPAFAALSPLLSEPFDRLEKPCQLKTVSSCASTAIEKESTDRDIPSLFLLGDSTWGLIVARGRRILPFYRGNAMAYPTSTCHLYEDGHFSGLLLFRNGQVMTENDCICHRENGAVTLAYRAKGGSVFARFAIFPDLLSITLSTDCIGDDVTALFCLTPISTDSEGFRLETLPIGNILLLHAKDYIAGLAADDLDRLFIRAEEAPLPLGEVNFSSLLDRVGSFTEGTLLTPTCKIGGRLKIGSNCRIRLAFGQDRAEVLDKLTSVGSTRQVAPCECALPPLPSEDATTASYATMLELQQLFEHLRLRPVQATPECEGAILCRRIEESLRPLEARGFMRNDTPLQLPKSGELPTDELLKRCLRASEYPPLTSTPMPERTRLRLTDSALTIKKGRDLPPVCRVYSDRSIAFFADSYTPSLCFEGSDNRVTLTLTLPDRQNAVDTERSLFFSAAEVCYTEHEVCYIGEGYKVSASLSPDHLLILEVLGSVHANLRLTLPPPSARSEDSDFWHRDSDTVDFCSRITQDSRTVFLLGSFRRSADRRYYSIREEMNLRLLEGRPLIEHTPDAALLTWQGQPPYPTPLLVHPALASDTPEAFPLLLIFRPSLAYDALVRIFETDNRLMQVSTCLLWEKSTEDRDALRRKITHPTASGSVEESIYLAAARSLDALCEETNCPLLPYLVADFAELAHRMGDFAGEALYRSRVSVPSSMVPSSQQARSFQEIACLLLAGDRKGTAAWKERIRSLPLFPAPEESSALWSLFWYGVLGYRETGRGFSLNPLLCDSFDRCCFTLRRKGSLYRIAISFSDHASCLLDGNVAEMPFLFDKKEHFLEITVEKSHRMV